MGLAGSRGLAERKQDEAYEELTNRFESNLPALKIGVKQALGMLEEMLAAPSYARYVKNGNLADTDIARYQTLKSAFISINSVKTLQEMIDELNA